MEDRFKILTGLQEKAAKASKAENSGKKVSGMLFGNSLFAREEMRTPNLLGLPEKPQAINSEALSRKAKVVAQLFFSGEGAAAQTVRGGEKKPEAAPQAGVKKESLTGDDDEKIKSQQPDPTWVEGDREVPVDARTLFPEAAEQISLLEKNLLLRRKGDKTPAVAPGEKKDAEVRIVAAPDHGLEKEGTAPLARGG
ncbi:MAG TPA: hypothetical protein PKV71_08640 [Calditrichia bacterium]|nr:hypothetical protein [Calditrichia bacterium]